MVRRYPAAVLFAFALTLSLAGCGAASRLDATAGPVGFASAAPSAQPTATATSTITATATATPTAAPTAVATLPVTSPTILPPSATPMPSPSTATLTSPPPVTTPAPPSPSLTPVPAPTVTPVSGQPHDPANIQVELRQVVGGLDRPLGIAHAGDGSGRLFLLEKGGRIRIVRDGTLLPTPFLDIANRVRSSGSEQGLLGLAFHPPYVETGFFYVNYTDRQGNTVVARFSASSEPDRADPASESILLTLDQPAPNHNGGNLAFGPDGYLYIGTGDGGGAGDQYGNGQNGQSLLGKMLRLDIDGGQPYAIPPDNPFVGDLAVRDEIWAIGLRNPWRYSFDRLTGDLYIGDVGQNTYEEIDFQPAASRGGQNYGWPIMEGSHCYPASRACDRAGLTLPVEEYDHSQGCSVTGGYLYRGHQVPLLTGIYLFGDYCSGNIWGLARSSSGNWQAAQVAQTNVHPSSFGEDQAGELYLVDLDGGVLYRIDARPRE